MGILISCKTKSVSVIVVISFPIQDEDAGKPGSSLGQPSGECFFIVNIFLKGFTFLMFST